MPEWANLSKLEKERNALHATIDDLLGPVREGSFTPPRVGGEFRRTTRLPMTPEELASPIHAKHVKCLCYEALLEMAKGHPLEARLIELLRYNLDPSVYAPLDDTPARMHISRVPKEDIEALINAEIAKAVPSGTVKRFGKLFTVYEAAKHRRRPILWPMEINDFLNWEGMMTLKSLIQHMSEVLPGDWSSCFDLMAGFFQCALADGVQPYYGFADEEGNEYVFTRMVMGSAYAVELMDTIMRILCTTDIDASLRTTVHVDNVRWLGQHQQVAAAGAQFVKNCDRVGASWNKEPLLNVPHQHGVFCGVLYDYKRALTRIPPKGLEKLEHALTTFNNAPSVRSMTALFGLLFHLSPIVGISFSKFYHALKYYRRKVSALQAGIVKLDDPANVWNCIHKGMNLWLDEIRENKSAAHSPFSHAECNLFTDASDAGWGAYFIDTDGSINIVAGSWSALERKRSINEREAMAVANGISAFRHLLTDRHVNVHIDNSSVCWSLTKGHSPRFNLNQRLLEVQHLLVDMRCRITVCYVPSALNFADEPSRHPDRFPTVCGSSASSSAQLSSPSGLLVGMA